MEEEQKEKERKRRNSLLPDDQSQSNVHEPESKVVLNKR